MRPAFFLLASCCLTAPLLKVCASDKATVCTITCTRLEDLEKQAERVETLERDLAMARAEIIRLKAAPSGRSQKTSPVWIHPAVQKAAEEMTAPRLLDGLKPVATDDVVDPLELLAHFATDPRAAEARYSKKSFELRGIVAELDKTLFAAPYQIVFRLPGSMLRGVCEIFPPERYGKVYVTEDRQRVVGETSSGKTTLATAGAEVRMRVRCQGSKAGAVRFDRCVLVSAR